MNKYLHLIYDLLKGNLLFCSISKLVWFSVKFERYHFVFFLIIFLNHRIDMKNLIILFCFVLLGGFVTAQEQNSYVKTVNPQSSEVVFFNTNVPVGVKEWKEDKLRILIDVVHDESIGTEILESLMQIGRYDVKADTKGGEFVIDMPGLRNEILMGGDVIQEAISLLIFAPSNVKIETEFDDMTGVRMTKKGGFSEPLEMEFEFNVPFMMSFGGETVSAATPVRGETSELENQVSEKNAELQAFVKELAAMQKELEVAYKDEMTPEDHQKVDELVMGIEQKNQDLQVLFNELSNLQTLLDETYGQ